MQKLYAFLEKRSVDLSLSENPLGCSPLVVSALKKIAISFNDYPKANGFLLKSDLAGKFNLESKNFFIANGSEAIIINLPRVFGQIDGEIIMPALTFPMFEISAQLGKQRAVLIKMKADLSIDLVAILTAITSKTRMIFLCNPNNPTGNVLKKSQILDFMAQVPESVLLVIDEANIEFGGDSLINEISNRKNLLIIRTFSKGFGLANLRIGFIAANENLITKLEAETQPFPISGLSENLARFALRDADFIDQSQKFIDQERRLMSKTLQRLSFKVFPSGANNLFVQIPPSISVNLFAKFLKQADISVVTGDNFKGFDNRFFRVSIRSAEVNRKFLKELELRLKSKLAVF